jgi:hypothetical protein
MNETEVAALKVITLPDEQYFSLDAARLRALQGNVADLLRPKGARLLPPGTSRPLTELLIISAPARLDLTKRTTFPLVLASVRSGRREWEVQARQNRVFVVSNVNTGSVDVMAPLDPGRRMPVYPPSKSGDPPDPLNAAAGAALVTSFELFKWFKREALQGRNAVTLIEYDRRSNTALVDAAGEPGSTPARRPVQRVLAQAAAASGFAGDDQGVVFSAPASIAPTASGLVQARVRLPRTEVTAINAPPNSPQRLLLAATLLLIKLDEASAPRLIHLVVPVQPSTLSGGIEGIESAFTVDLRSGAAGRAFSGTYVAYLVVGTTVTGPQPITIAEQ